MFYKWGRGGGVLFVFVCIEYFMYNFVKVCVYINIGNGLKFFVDREDMLIFYFVDDND